MLTPPHDGEPGGSPGHRSADVHVFTQCCQPWLAPELQGHRGKNSGVLWEQHQKDVCLSLCLPEPLPPSCCSSFTLDKYPG